MIHSLVIGVPRHDQDITIHTLSLHFGRMLTGCDGRHTNPAEEIPHYLKLYEDGKLKLDHLVTHRYPLKDINTALDKLRGGEAGRYMLNMR